MARDDAVTTGRGGRLLQHASKIQGLVAVHVTGRLEAYREVGVPRKLAHLQGRARGDGALGEEHARAPLDRALDVGPGSIAHRDRVRAGRCRQEEKELTGSNDRASCYFGRARPHPAWPLLAGWLAGRRTIDRQSQHQDDVCVSFPTFLMRLVGRKRPAPGVDGWP